MWEEEKRRGKGKNRTITTEVRRTRKPKKITAEDAKDAEKKNG